MVKIDRHFRFFFGNQNDQTERERKTKNALKKSRKNTFRIHKN